MRALLVLGVLLLVGCSDKKRPCQIYSGGELVVCNPGFQCRSEQTPKSLIVVCIPEEKAEPPTTPTKSGGQL